MKFRIAAVLVCFIAIQIAALSAQTPAPAAPRQPSRATAQPTPPATPAPPNAPAAPNAPAPPRVDPSEGGQLANVRVELSVLEQMGTEPATPKTMSLLLANGVLSQVRSSFDERNMLNVDVRPTIVDGRVRLTLTVEIVPLGASPGTPFGAGRHSLTVVLESGKATPVFESSDSAKNRKASIEVKATILK